MSEHRKKNSRWCRTGGYEPGDLLGPAVYSWHRWRWQAERLERRMHAFSLTGRQSRVISADQLDREWDESKETFMGDRR